MDRRPRLAGLLFGAMAFKPHLALVLPFALVFARRWTTLIVAAAIAAAGSGPVARSRSAAHMEPAFSPTRRSPARRWRTISSATRRCRASSPPSGCCMVRSLSPGERRSLTALARAPRSATCSGARSGRAGGRRRRSSAPDCWRRPFCSTTISRCSPSRSLWLLREGLRAGFLPFEKALMALRVSAAAGFARRRRRARPAACALDHRRDARTGDEARAEAAAGAGAISSQN